nr:hypothetical protein [Tanacetum cinerariifolium]
NLDAVDVVLVSQSNQVMHVNVLHKATGKTIYCSFVYARNLPKERRFLWTDLNIHKLVTRGKPWILLGDFNVVLDLEDTLAGSSQLSSPMCEFKDCVSNIKVMDLNSSGLHYTWNQKPRGGGGLFKKLDRIMRNIKFIDTFLRSYALFQPYWISDHSFAVLKIPNLPFTKPKPFKFYNFLTHKSQFLEPLRKILHDQGNLHDKVTKLRHELDEVQKPVYINPIDQVIREEASMYVQAFMKAKLDEELFLKQKAKI